LLTLTTSTTKPLPPTAAETPLPSPGDDRVDELDVLDEDTTGTGAVNDASDTATAATSLIWLPRIDSPRQMEAVRVGARPVIAVHLPNLPQEQCGPTGSGGRDDDHDLGYFLNWSSITRTSMPIEELVDAGRLAVFLDNPD
jgi:hypothetical protein